MKATTYRLSIAVLGLMVWAAGADAQATRTWVSGVGDDANPCSRTAPCKTFAGAISKTATGGEINTLDPAGFGGVTITKSITIASEGTGTAGVLVSGSNGIIVNAPATAVVILKGLDIDGIGTGLNGIRILSAAAVFVENCRINNFTQKGIDFEPTVASALFVKDTTILNNTNSLTGGGIFAQGTATGTASLFLDNVSLHRNLFGLRSTDFTKAEVRNSSAVGNSTNGFWGISNTGSPVVVTVENSRTSLNGVAGLRSEGAATRVRITETTITDNLLAGILTGTSGQVLSFGNNRNTGNGADTPAANGAPTSVITQQ